MIATDTTYNGASPGVWAAIDSVQPPYVIWDAYEASIGHPTHPELLGFRAYKLVTRRITSGTICGPMGTDVVATAIFAANGGPLSHREIERLDRGGYRGGVPTGWRLNCNAVNVIRDLLRALADDTPKARKGAWEA